MPRLSGLTAGGVQQEQFIEERHRHRYEVNPEMVPQLEEQGLRFVGIDESVGPLPHRTACIRTA